MQHPIINRQYTYHSIANNRTRTNKLSHFQFHNEFFTVFNKLFQIVAPVEFYSELLFIYYNINTKQDSGTYLANWHGVETI